MKKMNNLKDSFEGPVLDAIKITAPSLESKPEYPFTLPIIQNFKKIRFSSQVTFFVGENGTGKSTFLEAVAHHVGLGPEGGSKNISFKTSIDQVYSGVQKFADTMTLSWRQKPKDAYFFRAESFHNVANFIDMLERECGGNAYKAYGGKSLHSQSHGESFFSFFKHRMGKGGFFVLDEPEAALSPLRQLALLSIIKDLCKHSNTQFIIATHSPILLAYPHAKIYSFDGNALEKISYTETQPYQITKEFLADPSRYFKNLFEEE